MRRSGALAAVLALTAGLLVAGATVASATPASLPITGYADMLVDEPHGHLYFTSGSSTVTVTDLAGANPVSLSGMAGAYGLALSPDGSVVYVAAEGAHAIDAINTTSLAVTTVVTGLGCPHSLAYAGGKLYFSYSCTNGQGAIGSLDFSTSPPRVRTGYASGWYSAPKLASGGPSTGVLVAGETNSSPATIVTYDVSGGSPQSPRTPPYNSCENFDSAAVDSRGVHIAIACGWPYHVAVFNASDMSVEDSYGDNAPYPTAVSFSKDDAYLAAGFTARSPNVVEYPFGTPSSAYASYTFDAGGQGDLPADGLRFGPSGKLYAVVPTDVYGDGWDLFVAPAPTTAPASVTVSAPSTSALDAALSVSGMVSSPAAFTSPVTLNVLRIDLSGVYALPSVQTDATGHYSFSDTPHVGSTVRYEVSYNAAANGDSIRRNAFGTDDVDVPRLPTSIAIATTQPSYEWADQATVVAHLGTTYNSRSVSVYARQYGQPSYRAATLDADSDGNVVVGVNVYERETFTAVFDGDYRHAPARASITVPVHAMLEETLYRSYGSAGGYALYHHSTNPLLQARMFPNLMDVCLYGRVQRYYRSAWHTVATSSCLRTSASGEAAVAFRGTRVLGSPYRFRVEWRGNTASAAKLGDWMRFKFRT